jgi:hypothetical protein
MKTTILAASVLLLSTGATFAQNAIAGSTSASGSQSVSGVSIEGSNIPDNTPNAGIAIGSAGDCYPGAAFGASGPGWGVSAGGGQVDQECNVRAEMAALAVVAGNRVAVAHACKHDRSMRQTLVELGLCKVTRSEEVVTPQNGNAPRRNPNVSPNPERVAYTKCELDRESNQLRVAPARGFTAQTAVRECRDQLGF